MDSKEEHTTSMSMSSTSTGRRRPCTAIKDKGHNERLSLSWSQSLEHVHNSNNNNTTNNAAAAAHRSRAASSLGGSQEMMEAPVRIAVLLLMLYCIDVVLYCFVAARRIDLTLFINL
jgi:hypothetical protein